MSRPETALRPYGFEIPVALYAAVALMLASVHGWHISWGVLWNWRVELGLVVQGAPWLLTVVLLHQHFVNKVPPSECLRNAAAATFRFVRDWRAWLEVLRILVALKICLTVYTHLKQEIPLLNPRLFDAELATIDRVLHAGFDMTRVLPALLTNPSVARFVDASYAAWYFLKAPILLFFLFHPDRNRARHFFTSYFLLWIVAGSFAIAVPSLGPVYVDGSAWEGLNIPTARGLQNRLWQHYQEFLAAPENYRAFQYEGIAAFPSLHVGCVVLYAAALWPWRWAFWLMTAYALLVQFGSVALGWHYAIDGYFAAALAIGLFIAIPGRRPEKPPTPSAVLNDDPLTQ